jgi:hypothetical protein
MLSQNSAASMRRNRLDNRDALADELAVFEPIWSGALHEFRNHLTVLLAAANELRASLPAAIALDVADAVAETERNVQNLSSLVAQIDAVVKSGEPLISDLDEMIERALRIAAPALGRRVSVSVSKGRKAGARNRGATLECLLASLIVDLARAADTRTADASRRPRLQINVEVGRGALIVEIESNGGRPPAGSWRFLLATELAAKLDASVAPHPDLPGYVVQFR